MELQTPQEYIARKALCVTLDQTKDEAKTVIRELAPYVGLFKIGPDNPESLSLLIRSQGSHVLWDLQHEPTTDYGVQAAQYGINIMSCHGTLDVAGMRAFRAQIQEGADLYGTPLPTLVAVTILTSVDLHKYVKTFQPKFRKAGTASVLQNDRAHVSEPQQEEFNAIVEEFDMQDIVREEATHLGELARDAGLDGIICRACDVKAVKQSLPDEFIYITPAGGDHMLTPAEAIRAGSNIVIVDKAIMHAPIRTEAAYNILQAIAKEL